MRRLATPPVLTGFALAGLALSATALPTSAQEAGKTDPPKVEKPRDSKGWTPKKITGIDLSKIKVKQEEEEAHDHGHPSNRSQETVPFRETEKGNVKLVVEEGSDTFDFGKLAQGESPSHTFTLQVDGEEDLIIKRVKPSCGCTVAQTDVISAAGERSAWEADQPVAPGSTLEVQATLKTEGKHGNVSTNVAIYSNDAEFAVRRLTLKAKVDPIVNVEPPSYNFGQITPFDTAEGVITLRSTSGTPFGLELMDETALRDELRVELVALDANADGAAVTWEARLGLGPDLGEGIKNYPLRFKTDIPLRTGALDDDGQPRFHEYRAYAMAQVQGLIYTTPNYSAFGMMRPGEVQARTFRIHTRDPEFDFPEAPAVSVKGFREGEDFELPENIDVVARRSPDKKSLEVDIKVFDLPEDFEGSFSGFVEVEVGHASKETVRSRFSGIARPGVQKPAGS